MWAVTVTEPGGPEVLQWTRVPDPPTGPGELGITVAAAGVNRADLLQRQGHYPAPPGAPEWPGLEISGTVDSIGPGVVGWSVGDKVCALLPGGGYAERVVVPASLALPVPPGVTLLEAAALPEAAATAWSNLVMVANLRAGETVLVHGGSGGVGSHAVQLASALGAQVITTARDRERCDLVLGLGADVAIAYEEEDVAARIREVTAGRGVDVVLDILGAGGLDTNVRSLARDGRLVIIGLQRGRVGEIDLNRVLARRITVTGTLLRSRPLAERAAIITDVRDHVWPFVADGRVRPVVHATLPMTEAGAAHELLDSGEVLGKVLLVPPDRSASDGAD